MGDGFAGRLRGAMDERGMTITKLAEDVGVALSTMRGYLAGASPRVEVAFAISEILGVDIRWLVLGQGVKHPGQSLVGHTTIAPESATHIPYLAEEYFAKEEYNSFHFHRKEMLSNFRVGEEWLKSELGHVDIASLRLICVADDSMSPNLRHGNLVIVSLLSGTDIPTNGVYAVRFSNSLFIRRFDYGPSGIVRMKADNSEYTYYDMSKDDITMGVDHERPGLVSVVGRILYVGHRI